MPRRTILVDGYNFIGTVSILRAARLEKDREALMDRLSRYAAVRGHRVVAVFDGAGRAPDGRTRRPHPGVEALFSPAGVKADDVIVRRCRDLRGECVVVTDDHGVRDPCRHAGALVLACQEMESLLARSEREPVPAPPPPGASAPTPPARRPAPAAPLSAEDRAAWEAFAAQVEAPLPRDEPPPRPATRAAAGAAPAAAPAASIAPAAFAAPAADPAPDPWEVTDAILAAKDADEEVAERADRGPTRDERRRQHMRDDL